METIKGYSLTTLPFSGLNKVADLIEYDGPFLSHFKDDKNNNYLFCWIDNNNEYNRWLVWKISNLQLYEYLSGLKSLKELFNEPNKDFIYSVDINSNIEYHNVLQFDILDTPQSYLIEDNSPFSLDISPLYKNLIEEYETNFYIEIMREKALYFKVVPKNKKYLTTVSTVSASDFLKRLSDSFLNFVEVDFFQSFSATTADYNLLKKTVAKLKEFLIPRIVQLEYSSFKVGISTDNLHAVNNKYSDWQANILEKYKHEVVEIDYNSSETLKEISKKYEEEDRRKIFSPYISILNDKLYNIEVTNFKRSFIKTYSTVSKGNIEIIIPKKSIEEEKVGKKLYNVVIEVSENQDLTKIGKHTFNEGLLFSQEVDEVEMSVNEIKTDQHIVILKRPLKYIFSTHNSNYIVESKEFEIGVQAEDKDLVIKLFNKKFIENYFNLQENEHSEYKYLEDLYKEIVQNIEPTK